MRPVAVVCLALTPLIASCRPDARHRDTIYLAEEVRLADQALLQAEQQRDLDGVMALVATHAVFQPPEQPPIQGEEAIRRFYDEQWFAIPFTEISGVADTIVVSESGDLAYLAGRSHLVVEVSGDETT